MSIISGLLQQKQSNKIGWMMDAQLSLAPPSSLSSSSSIAGLYLKKRRPSAGDPMFKDSEDDHSNCKKRKMGSEWEREMQKFNCVNSSIGVELQMKSPLPLEWEQCLDLQSGRIYYVNRSTQMKTSQDPRGGGHGSPNQSSKDLRLDLELNLPLKSQENDGKSFEPPRSDLNNTAYLEEENSMNDTAEMVATVCAHCHMFIMFSKVSRQCPNCKYVHPSRHQEEKDDNSAAPAKQTLSLIDCGLDSKITTRGDDE